MTDWLHLIGCTSVTNSSNLVAFCYMNQIITMMAQMAIEPNTFSTSVSSVIGFKDTSVAEPHFAHVLAAAVNVLG